MTVEEMSGPPVELWPEHEIVVRVFSSLDTQWRYAGMGSAVGLIYSEMPFVFEMEGIDRKDWPTLFDDLRVMERAVLVLRSQNQ